MEQNHLKKIAAPVVLGLAVAVAFGLGVRNDMQTEVTPRTNVVQEPTPREIWRCHACARIRGKNWTPCRTVTGRGTERAAQDLVQVRVCADAPNPATDCRITRMDCSQLDEAEIVPAKRVKINRGNEKARQGGARNQSKSSTSSE